MAREQTATSPAKLMTGVTQFNAEEFYESHETWEWLWRGTDYPLRLFFLSLTKLGAGFTHAQRGNPTGMRRLLSDGLRYLEPFLPSMMGLDTSRLDSEIRQWLNQEPWSSPRSLPRIERIPAQP
jgi:predicted metal-dependent hydrolase